MGVIDGTPVDAATTNPAFLDANADDTGQGKYTMANTDPISGPSITNIQREHNSIASFVGKLTNAIYNLLPTFTNNQGFTTATQSLFDRIEELSQKFNNTLGIGHDHSGPGMGVNIDAGTIVNPKLRAFVQQAPTLTGVTGSSTDVSSDFVAKVPSGGDTSLGVVVLAPNNKVVLQQGSGANEGDAFVDGSGNVVYGRLSFSTPTWTLSYFVNLSGTETAYSFGSAVDVRYFYQEIYNPLTSGPVYSEYASIPSDNATQDVVDATATQRGLISASTQTLGGAKTWNAVQTFVSGFINQARSRFELITDSATTGTNAVLPYAASTAIRVTNASLVSIEEISSPLSGGYFMLINETGGDIDLKNNSGTVGNRILTGTGTDFTLKASAMTILHYDSTGGYWHMVAGGAGGPGFNIVAFGSTPNANGASYNSLTGAFNLEPADSTNPGSVSTVAQTFAGDKTFADDFIQQALFRGDVQTDSTVTGSNADLTAPTKTIIRLTNASLVSIQRVLTMAASQISVLVNKTGNPIILINNFGANGFLTGTGSNLTLQNNASVLMVYDSVSSRVMIIGGPQGGSSADYAFRVGLGSNQSIALTTNVDVLFDTVRKDTHSGFNTSTGEYTIPTGGDGEWEFFAQTYYGGFTGYAYVLILKNGSSFAQGYSPNDLNYGGSENVNDIIDCVAGDVIKVQTYQASSGAQSLIGNTEFTMFWGRKK